MVNINGKNLCEHCFEEVSANGICGACSFESNNSKYPTALPENTILNGRYVVGRVLGKGGFGITYLCYDSKEQKKIAIKEYLPDSLIHRNTGETVVSTYGGESEEYFKAGAQKFYEEARLVSRFNGNPNIIGVYEFFYENNTAYFVMEYLDGIDLKNYIRNNGGRISEEQTLYVMNKAAEALMIVHSTGVLHRDISPDNIFLCTDGKVKLIDFGAARQVVGEASKSLSVILKQGFAPLEQYQKKGNQGPWTDIYALGATFYYSLTGKIIDDAMSRLEDPSLETENVTPQLAAIIEKMLSVDIKSRYQNVFELKGDLSALTIVPEEIKIETPSFVKEEKQDYVNIRTEDIEIKAPETKVDPPLLKDKKPNKKILTIAGIAAAVLVALIVIIIAVPKGDDIETDIPQNGIVDEDGGIDLNDIGNIQGSIPYTTGEALLSAGKYHTVAVNNDGTVFATGQNDNGQCDVSHWRDIVAVSAGDYHTVGLKKDGTVVAVGYNEQGQCDLSGWTDIVAVSAGEYHTAGLKSDGTVVIACEEEELKGVSDWTDITSLSSGTYHVVGLKKDGTVVAVGSNLYNQCKVSGWKDIVAVSAGYYHTVGVKADGTVIAIGYNKQKQCDASAWTDIKAVACGFWDTVGLKEDGTVTAIGEYSVQEGRVSEWSDIIAISKGFSHTVGLKKDGTLVATGENGDGQCNVSEWSGIGTSSGESVAPVKKKYYHPDDTSDNVSNFFSDLYNSDGTLRYTFYTDYLDNQNLYRIDAATGKKKHLSGIKANLIFAVNDDMLVFQNAEDHGYLYSCDLDGNNKKLIHKAVPYNLGTDGEWLYYKDSKKDDEVYKINLTTFEIVSLFSDNVLCTYYKGFIYYIDKEDGYLCRRDTDGMKRTVLIEKAIGMLVIVNDKIYYCDDDYSLCVCDLEGNSVTKLASDCDQFTISDGTIYYAEQDGGLYSISITGENKTFIDKLPNYRSDGTSLFYAGNNTAYFFYVYGDEYEFFTLDIE